MRILLRRTSLLVLTAAATGLWWTAPTPTPTPLAVVAQRGPDGDIDLHGSRDDTHLRLGADGDARLTAPGAPELILRGGPAEGPATVYDLPDGMVRVDVPLAGGGLAWWEADDQRLRQGWTFASLPADGQLVVEVDAGGAGQVVGDQIGVGRPGHGWLGSGLAAWDAHGRELAIRATPTPSGFALRVDTTHATPPVMVDPTWQPWAWSRIGEQPGAGFAEVIRGVGDVNGDGFADVVISTPRYSNITGQQEGRAELIFGDAAGLSTSAARVWTTTTPLARFGATVDGGDLNSDGYADVIVGAPGDASGEAGEGLVRVWWGGPAGPAQAPDVVLEGGSAAVGLGEAVVVPGDLDGDGVDDLVLGAVGEVRVHLGSLNGPGPAADQGIVTPGTPAEAGDMDGDGHADLLLRDLNYGYDPGSGDTGWWYTGPSTRGQVTVLRGDSGGVDPAPWVTWTGDFGESFGERSAAAGDVNDDGFADVLIAQPLVVSLFLGGSSPPTVEAQSWHLPDWSYSGWLNFGDALAGLGDLNADGFDDFVVGAPDATNGQILEGRALVFLGSVDGPPEQASFSVEDDLITSWFGRVVDGVGDVNGDGYADFVAAGIDTPTVEYGPRRSQDLGRAFLYFGSASPETVDATLLEPPVGSPDHSVFGRAIAGLGDANADGFDDLLITDPGLYGGGWLLPGATTGPSSATAEPLEIPLFFSDFGVAVGAAGDVNGDGLADAIVGTVSAGYWHNGMAALYLGSSTGAPTVEHVWEAAPPDNQFAAAVAGVGDLNADGFDEVAIGVSDDNFPSYSHVNVYNGGPAGLTGAVDHTRTAIYANTGSGHAIAGACDLNGDGYDDLITSAESGGVAGRVDHSWVYLGGTSGPATAPITLSSQSAAYDVQMDCAGDVNADGYEDLVVGVLSSQSTTAVLLHLGGPQGPSRLPDRVWTGPSRSSFGGAVSGVGDLNADGYDDIIAASPAAPWEGGVADGARFVGLWGGPDGPAQEPSWGAPRWIVPGDHGYILAGAGDVNGDGFDDLALSVAGIPGTEGVPAAVVLYGSPDGPAEVPTGATIPRLPHRRTQFVGEGLMTRLDAQARFAGAVSYSWDFGDGTRQTGARLLHAWPDDGVYNLRLVAAAPDGFDHEDSKVVVHNVAPVVFDAPDVTGAVGVPVPLVLDVYDVDPLTVAWGAAPQGPWSGNPAQATFLAPGRWTVSYTVTDGDGGITTGTITAQIGPAVFTLLPPTLRPGVLTQLTAVNSPPGARVYFFATTHPGVGPTCAPAGSPCVDLTQPRSLGSAAVDRQGVATLSVTLPAGVAAGTSVRLQAVTLGAWPRATAAVDATVAR